MYNSKSQVLDSLQALDSREFEKLLSDIWEQLHWETTVTSATSDQGIDIIVKKDTIVPLKLAIQAKCYTRGNKIGSPEIQKYGSILNQENDVDAVVIVTTSSFTNEAKTTAEDLNIKLIDDDKLYTILLEAGITDILDKYIGRYNQANNQSQSPREVVQKSIRNYSESGVHFCEEALFEEITYLMTEPVEKSGYLNKPAINYIDRPEPIYMMWKSDGINPFFSTHRDGEEIESEGSHSCLHIISETQFITAIGKEETDNILKIGKSDINIEETSLTHKDRRTRYGFVLELYNPVDPEWCDFKFDKFRFNGYNRSTANFGELKRMRDYLSNKVFKCEECGQTIPNSNKIENNEICTECFRGIK